MMNTMTRMAWKHFLRVEKNDQAYASTLAKDWLHAVKASRIAHFNKSSVF